MRVCAAAVADSEKLQAIYDMVQETTREKSPVSISKIDTNIWLRVEANANLKRNIVEDIQASVPKELVPALDWDDGTEQAQSVRLNTGSACFFQEHFDGA